jgi:hypothetical protein
VDYSGITSRIEQTTVSGSRFLLFDQYLPSPRPSGGHWSSLALASACRGQWLFLRALMPSATERGKAARATLMRVDLQKVDAEITALRSELTAINDDLDECRRGYL